MCEIPADHLQECYKHKSACLLLIAVYKEMC